ncbi:TolC family protein [uncultured Oxalicibacterium sp.]|uniref:TolC family protein n=1 Tax=uncultured Oxalicibacterium sp. TaxID=1168540 RepID=UPI0025D2ED61|nr:TolC family protein [uncultured Oxalicibacterium sp.]
MPVKLAQSDPAVANNRVPPNGSNAAVASRLTNKNGEDDEILRMLREADAVFAGTAIALPDTLMSADGPLQSSVSLEEALARTLQNSYSYTASSARAEGAVYAKNAALGQLGPSLDFRGQRGREYSAPASFVDQTTGRAAASDTHNRWDTSVVLRQPLFSPASYFDYRKNASLADAADMRREDARESLYYQAVKAYYDLIRAYAAVTFANRYAQRMEGLQDYMDKRVQGGGASRVDFERVRGRALSAKSAVIEAEGALESALVTLTQLTGVRTRQVTIPQKMMPLVPGTSLAALEKIYETNPAVRAAREDAAAASQELRAARSRFSPTFSVEMSQIRTNNAGGDGVLTTDRRYMFVMNMNLLNGGSDYYYQKEVGTRYVDKANTASDIERKLKEQIEINYRTLDAVKKRIRVARQAYETNAGVADIFLDQLATGSKQLLDVLDAYQQAYQSQVDLVQLLFLQADISYQILRNTGRAAASFEDQH